MNRDEWNTCLDVLRDRIAPDDALGRCALNLIEINVRVMFDAPAESIESAAHALGHRRLEEWYAAVAKSANAAAAKLALTESDG